MRNIKLIISYDGTNYRGWQVQKNGPTVQGMIEEALGKIFGTRYRLNGASRTDSGVHARAQVANFKTASNIQVKNIRHALNSVLPPDIAIKHVKEVPLDFHSRFNAGSKRYRYYISVMAYPDPFSEGYCWRVPYKLDVPLMKKEISMLVGLHDFKSFQASDKKEKTSRRRVLLTDVKKKGSLITVDIEANGFLYNMVRNIVGTVVDIGRGYLAPGSMKKILSARDRTLAGPTAPAKGLFLVNGDVRGVSPFFEKPGRL